MRVLVNMLGVRAGGARTYLLQMLQYLATARQPHEYVVLAAPWVEREWLAMHGPETRAVRVIPSAISPARRLYFDQIELPRLVRRERADVLWSPNNYACFRSPVPQLLMVCNPVYFSNRYRSLMRRYGNVVERADYRARRAHARASVRRADVSVFPTRAFMDRVLGHLWDRAVRQPHPLHHGFDASLVCGRGSAPRPDDGGRDAQRMKLLYPTSWAPHKNFGVLFDAVEILARDRYPFELWLTMDGDEASYRGPYRRWIASDFARLKHARGSVRWIGYLSSAAVARRYAAADVVLFPSWLETFGYPLAEARAAGVPLVAADTPTNREVAGDATEYHPPFDAPALAAAIVRAVRRQARPDRDGLTSWGRHFDELGRLMKAMA